jgi:hypothetical protein
VLLCFTRRALDGEVALDLTAESFADARRGSSRVREDSREEICAWLFGRADLSDRRGRGQSRGGSARGGVGWPTLRVHVCEDTARCEETVHLAEESALSLLAEMVDCEPGDHDVKARLALCRARRSERVA